VQANRLLGNGIDVFGQTGNAAGSGAFVDDASFSGLVDNRFSHIKFGSSITLGSPHSFHYRFYSGFNGFITQPPIFVLAGAF